MKWVTREKARVDRIACPWLITRFIDKNPTFLFVPANQVMAVAEREGPSLRRSGVELGHVGDHCSFDAFLEKHKLDDPALRTLAVIVRGADTDARQLTPESAGLYALATGFQAIAKDDHDNMSRQFHAYDALYAYCRARIPPALDMARISERPDERRTALRARRLLSTFRRTRSRAGFDHAAVHGGRGLLYVAHTANDAGRRDRLRDQHVPPLHSTSDAGSPARWSPKPTTWSFTSNRGEDTVGIFSPSREETVAKVKVGVGPNGLAYGATQRLLLAANVGDPSRRGSFTVSLVDISRAALIANVPVPGRTRWTVFDQESGRFYVNIMDPPQIVVVDTADPRGSPTRFQCRQWARMGWTSIRRRGVSSAHATARCCSWSIRGRAPCRVRMRSAACRTSSSSTPLCDISTSRSAIPESSTSSIPRRCDVLKASRRSAARTRSASTRSATPCMPSCQTRIARRSTGTSQAKDQLA